MINNLTIPIPGFGTDQVPEGETIINSVTWAIESGYRHIDNADCYNNQIGVGIAIKNCIVKGLVKREDLFIVNKVPDWKQGYDSTIKCCKESLKLTGLDYFDLYLVHSPRRSYENWKQSVLDTYRAIETLYKEGLVKAIGVSNFEIRHLEFILEEAEIKPVVNQIEFHPQHQQKHVVDFCKKHDIQIVGWGTLNQGRIFNNEVFKQLADKYHKDIGQIATRYSYQKGVTPLVRSTKKERIESNGKIFDFAISSEDMLLLDSLGGEPLINPELSQMLEYAAEQKKIFFIQLITNGTMVPQEKLLNVLKQYNNRIYLYMSNYADNPELKSILKQEQIRELLKENNIKLQKPEN